MATAIPVRICDSSPSRKRTAAKALIDIACVAGDVLATRYSSVSKDCFVNRWVNSACKDALTPAREKMGHGKKYKEL
jgi:hypothetical protein